MAFLSGYTRRKAIFWVKNNTLLTNYQIKFTPHKSSDTDSGADVYLGDNVQDDFDDIRFTKGDGETLFDQWREEYESGVDAEYWAEIGKVGSSLATEDYSAAETEIDVADGSVFAQNDYVIICDDDTPAGEIRQISSISTNTLTVAGLTNAYTTAANAKVCHMAYMYYKDDAASLSSEGADTFPFFDHFIGDTLDTDKWAEVSTPTVSVSNSEVAVSRASTAAVSARIQGKTSFGTCAFRTRLKVSSIIGDSGRGWGLKGQFTERTDDLEIFEVWAETQQVCSRASGTTEITAISGIVANTYAIYDILFQKNTEAKFYLNDVLKDTDSTHIPNVDLYPFLGVHPEVEIHTVTSDWVLVRKYVKPEPTWGTWGSEEVSVTLTPAVAVAIAASVNPTVVKGSSTLTPAVAVAIAASVNPTVVKGITLTPAAAEALAAVLGPTVLYSSTTYAPVPAVAIATTLDPTVIKGSMTITPSPAIAIADVGSVVILITDPPSFPTMVVRIAFDSDPLDAVPSWTDVTSDFVFANIKRGRQHELDRIEAGTAIILLNNRHGNYYPDNDGGSYYPNIKTKKRINIRATYRGTTYDLFTGFVEGWQPDWLGDGGLGAVMRVNAAGITKHLAGLLLNDDTGYSEEKSGTRIGNVLDDLGWPAGDRDLDIGQSDIQASGALENENAMEHLWKVQESEAGIVFAQGDGTVVFQDRHARLKSPLTVSQSSFGADGRKIRDIDFSRDDSFVFNDIRITRAGGTEQVAADTDSQTEHGKLSLSKTGLLITADTEAQAQADYLLSRYKDDHTRVKRIDTLPQANVVSLFPIVLNYDISTRITVKKTAAGINNDYHIEGIEHTIDMKKYTWQTRWQLSDADGQRYWSIGVAGFSEIGETTRVAY